MDPQQEEIKSQSVSIEYESQKINSKSKIRVIFLFGVLILILVILCGLLFLFHKNNLQKPKSVNKIELNKQITNHSLVYSREYVKSDNKVAIEGTYLYDLDSKENQTYIPEKKNDNTSNIPGKIVYFFSSPNEINYLTKSDEDIRVLKFNKESKELDIVAVSKDPILLNSELLSESNFSPKNDKFAFTQFIPLDDGINYRKNIFIWYLRENKIKQITFTSGYDTANDPRWSGENNIVYRVQDDKAGESFRVFNLDNGKDDLLFSFNDHLATNTIIQYAYTPDSKKIIFSSHPSSGEENIMIIDVDTKIISKLFYLPYHDFTNPIITNDSKYLIWRSQINGEFGSQSIFSYNLAEGTLDTICKNSDTEWCGDFNLIIP